MKWYVCDQNNSRGYFVGNAEDICILAKDESEAWSILKSQDWWTEEYCECCGERWEGMEAVDEEHQLFEACFGEHLFIDNTGQYRNTHGRSIFPGSASPIYLLGYLQNEEYKGAYD